MASLLAIQPEILKVCLHHRIAKSLPFEMSPSSHCYNVVFSIPFPNAHFTHLWSSYNLKTITFNSRKTLQTRFSTDNVLGEIEEEPVRLKKT